jgi:LysM repeat protein
VGGAPLLTSVAIVDGNPRTVSFYNDAQGQVLHRDEADGYTATGDPHEIWFRFGGRLIGYVGNVGTAATDYPDSDNIRITGGQKGMLGGGPLGTSYADFDQSIAPVTTFKQGSAEGTYTVRSGDTLSGIAAALWGDASLWYKIAEANGLSGDGGLTAGQTLRIPPGVMASAHNASTFTPYDPTAIIGNVSPTTIKPPKQKSGGCGIIGQIILVIIAVVVTWLTDGAASDALSTIGITGTTNTVAAGAIAGAAGSIASQGVGVATGIQDKFSWNGVALSAIAGGVGGSGVGKSVSSNIASKFGNTAAMIVSAAAVDAVTQGISMAVGLQSKFSWSGVAAAGVASYVNSNFNTGSVATRAGVDIIAEAATRSLVDGTDFGDNIMAALPDVVGQTIGNEVKDEIDSAFNTPAQSAQSWDNSTTGGMGSAEFYRLLGWMEQQYPLVSDNGLGFGGMDISTAGAVNDWAHGNDDLSWLQRGTSSVHEFTRGANVNADGSLAWTPNMSGLTFTLDPGAPNTVASAWLAVPGIGVVRAVSNGQATHYYYGTDDAYFPDMGLHITKDIPEDEAIVVTGTGPSNYQRVMNELEGERQISDQFWGEAVWGTAKYMAENAPIIGDGINIIRAIQNPNLQNISTAAIGIFSPFLAHYGGRAIGAIFRDGADAAHDVQAAERVAAMQGDACFAAGTLVHTRDGLKPIEAITVGDVVLAQPEFQGERGYRRVREIFRRDPQDLVQVTIGSGSCREAIAATLEHPFWVKGAGWTGAQHLNEGQIVELADGRDARIVSVERVSEQQPVFNFAVDGFHTYYVGELGVWVHNASSVGDIVPVEGASMTPFAIDTPYGPALQSLSPEAMAARADVENGALLYRLGTIGKSDAAEAQFWALEHPFSEGYADRYGIPPENIAKFDFVETAVVPPGSPFVTRPAPGVRPNLGGGIEVVVPPRGVVLNYFGKQ